MQPGDWFYLPQRGSLSDLCTCRMRSIFLLTPICARLASAFRRLLALGTAYQSIQVKPAFNCWAIVATDSLAKHASASRYRLWHLSPGGQRQVLQHLPFESDGRRVSASFPDVPARNRTLPGRRQHSRPGQESGSSEPGHDLVGVLWGGDVVVPS